jgi:hypothetical protein
MPEVTRFDFFAAAALQGLLAGRNPAATPYTTEEIARIACECAEYMVKYTSVDVAKIQQTES